MNLRLPACLAEICRFGGRLFVTAFISSTLLLATAEAGETGELTSKMRAVVQRSLPFIERVGSAWMEDKSCNSCHAVTFQVWTHYEAAARGFEVDRAKLAEWRDWALADSLSDRYWFKLRPWAIEGLKADGLPDPVLAKLKPLIGVNHVKQQEFLVALEKALGRADLEIHKANLVRAATLPNNGGGPDTLGQLLLGRTAMAPEDKAIAESYAAIQTLLIEWQEPDGSWEAAGQLPELNWGGKNEMNEATTLWSVLALSPGDKPPVDATVLRPVDSKVLTPAERSAGGEEKVVDS